MLLLLLWVSARMYVVLRCDAFTWRRARPSLSVCACARPCLCVCVCLRLCLRLRVCTTGTCRRVSLRTYPDDRELDPFYRGRRGSLTYERPPPPHTP